MTHTLYLAVEFTDEDDYKAAVAQAYEAESPLIAHLELVVRSHFGGVIVNPVRNAVMLKVADAQTALRSVQLMAEILETAPTGVLIDPPLAEDVAQAQLAIGGCLEVIERGGQ